MITRRTILANAAAGALALTAAAGLAANPALARHDHGRGGNGDPSDNLEQKRERRRNRKERRRDRRRKN